MHQIDKKTAFDFNQRFLELYGLLNTLVLIHEGSTIISVLPGSRLQEVTRMLPIFSHTLELLKNDLSGLTAVIYVAPNKQVEDYIRKAVDVWPVPVVLVPGVTSCIKYNAFSVRPLI